MFSLLFSFLLMILMLFPSPLAGQSEDPYQYSFKLESLEPFFPGKSSKDIPDSFGPPLILNRIKGVLTYRYQMRHQRFHFPLFIQVEKGVILDFFIPLPSFFLHDAFLQSLINRWQKQHSFFHRDGNSLYRWKNSEGFFVYSGTCTITCFPLYLAGQGKRSQKIPSLLELMGKY